MKIGYSLLWGEFLQASNLDYALTTDLQIVCPCCKESIFKVERRLSNGGLTHYLAHRAAGDDAALAERQRCCELRVAAMTRADMTSEASGARGQTLEAFLVDLRERIMAYATAFHPYDGSISFPEAVSKLAANDQLRGLASVLRATVGPARRAEIEDHLLDPQGSRGFFEKTPALARIGVQSSLFEEGARFGRDLLAHLETPQAVSNWRYVVAAALVEGNARLRNELGAGPATPLYEAIAAATPSLRRDNSATFLWNLGRGWLDPVVAGHGPLRIKAERRRLVRLMQARGREVSPDAGVGNVRAGETLIEREAHEYFYKGVVDLVFMLPFAPVLGRYMDRVARGEIPLPPSQQHSSVSFPA